MSVSSAEAHQRRGSGLRQPLLAAATLPGLGLAGWWSMRRVKADYAAADKPAEHRTMPTGGCLSDIDSGLSAKHVERPREEFAVPVRRLMVGVRRRLLRLMVPMALVASACNATTGAEKTVRPFEEVQASEFAFEVDETNPSRAIFRVTTTEPMICAIVWGEDEALGNFNNSLNMAGTGIVQHDVFLPGALPGVEYSFVVQGTTADGTLYRSAMGMFVIPGSEASGTTDDDMVNLALNAEVVEVSSEFSDAFGADNAVDGDLGTEWSTAGDGDGASITLDLGGPVAVSGFEFLTRSMTDGSAITDTFTVTVDGGDKLGPFPAGNPADPQPADVVVTGQVFTFEVEASTGGNTGAVEIRVLEG